MKTPPLSESAPRPEDLNPQQEGAVIAPPGPTLVFAGAGGTSNLFYAFYLRDKQIGMGSRIPVLVNPFRNRQESRAQTGYI
ncbi:MAG: hypothetical protein QGH70_14910, partial [Nitrospinota bacterium]|nr:hypothetical protein [Nitrospinota bacterium]